MEGGVQWGLQKPRVVLAANGASTKRHGIGRALEKET